MNYFLLFLLLIFIGGLFFVRVKNVRRAQMVFVLCLLLSIAYYFFNKI